ncbi:MAG: hypothetical protein KUG77_12370 [Nannocystaceae bacterium]|nr:hypothetical protein [Nannocystaceae bacterium]
MKRLGLLAIAVTLGCNTTSGGDTDTDGNSGGGSSASETEPGPTETATATESDSANTESASGATTDDASSSTTDASSGEGSSSTTDETTSSEGTTSSESSSTGDAGPQALCEATEGTWDAVACGHYTCGIPNDCEAVIPGCDCGQEAGFVDDEGCLPNDGCVLFDCGDDLQCVATGQYCLATLPGVKGAPVVYECLSMVDECVDSVDCTCLTTALKIPPPAICDEPVPGGLIVQAFQP